MIKIISLAISIVILLGTLLLTPVINTKATGKSYYIAKSGADTNLGTEASPWLTIQKAADTIQAGDTVYIKNGVYSEYVYIGTSGPYTGNSGTQSAPITYKAYPGHNPVIECASLPKMDWRPLLAVGVVSNIIIDGLELRDNPYTYGVILAEGSKSITLRNLTIHNILKGGIMSWGVDGLLIDGCKVYDTNQMSASNEQVSLMPAYNFEIMNCQFSDSGRNGLNIKNGSSNGKVHHNQIWGSGYVYGAGGGTTTTGIYLDAQSKPIDNIKIYNNEIFGVKSAAIVLGSETSPYAPVTNVDVYNNLLHNNYQGFVVWPNAFSRNFRVFNNTFYDHKAHIAIYGDTGTNKNCEIKNNIISGTHADEYMIYYVPGCGAINIDHNLYYNSLGVYRASPNDLGTNAIKANPLFVAPGTNFQLTSDSPAKDAGIAAGAPLSDYAGTPRGLDAGYDIGAYELPAIGEEPVVQISYTDSVAIDCVYGNVMKAQTITPANDITLNSIRFQLRKSGSPAGNVEICITAADSTGRPVGDTLASASLLCATVTDSTQWHTFSFINDLTLKGGTKYAVCLSAPQGDSSNRIWYQVDTAGSYTSGFVCQTYSSGLTWTNLEHYDAVFEVVGW